MRSMRLVRATGLALAALLLPASCHGSFNLTRRVHHWNEHVHSDRWVKQATFVVLSVVPVYSCSVCTDVFVLNVGEFWTGRNWVDAPGGDHSLSSRFDGSPEPGTEDGARDRVELLASE